MLPNKQRIVISEFIDDEAALLLNQTCAITLDPNLLLTPHIAGLTLESNNRVSLMVARKVDEALQTLRPSHGS